MSGVITPSHTADILVIGAGIAGASIAAELAKDANVLLLEAEASPGYHATGRSAALYVPNYGPPAIQALSRASCAFYDAPPDGFSPHDLTGPRPILTLARSDQVGNLNAKQAALHPDSQVERLTGAAISKAQPLVREGYAAAALLEFGGFDIDVDALHQGYLRALKALGGKLHTNARVAALQFNGATWQLECPQSRFEAPIVVNAAGAWADEIALLAGVRQIGLVPKRRTAVIIAPPGGLDTNSLPITDDVDEGFYLKPDAGRLLISPADQTPSPPCDAQPDEMDVAICIDRIEKAFELSVRRIENKWAGLRSFAPDGEPVVGYDTEKTGFFWLAGQGGYGIQSAPALSVTAACLVLKRALPAAILESGFDPAQVSPARFSP